MPVSFTWGGNSMRTGLKISRGAQLLGAVCLVYGIVSCSQRSSPGAMSYAFLAGLVLIIGPRIYEWMTKE